MIRKHQFEEVKFKCSNEIINKFITYSYKCIYCGQSCLLDRFQIEDMPGSMAVCDKSKKRGTLFEMFKGSYNCLKKGK